jgi:hypothetical protein
MPQKRDEVVEKPDDSEEEVQIETTEDVHEKAHRRKRGKGN